MADRSEFMKNFRSSLRQKGKPPPVKRQETGAKATDQQVFKPQEHKRSAFTDSFFKYQGMMNKELERINKEAQKAEQDIIKQQQREGGAGLGAGAQPGAPGMAQEGLSPGMGAVGPPSGLEQLYQQSIGPDLQQTAFPQPGARQVTPEAPPPPGPPGPGIADIYGAMPEEGVEQIQAVGELGAAFGTGAAAFLPSMLGGYLEGAIPTAFPQVGVPPQPLPREKLTGKEKVEAVTEVQDAIAEELSYVPRTAAGRELTEFASWPFQKVQQFATWVSSAIVPESQPFLRKIADDTIHLGTYIVAHKTGRLSAKAFKEGVSKVRGIPQEKVTVANTEAAIKSAQDKLPKKIKKDTTEFLKNVKEKVAEKPVGVREPAVKPPVVEKVKPPAPPKPPVPVEKVPKPAPETIAKELDVSYEGPLVKQQPEGVHQFTVTKGEHKGVHAYVKPEDITLEKVRSELEASIKKHKIAEPPKPPTEPEMKAEVEAAGAIWGAVKEGKIDTTPWPATKTHPEGLRNFNSPYTESTLTIAPSQITAEAVKAKMLANYVETKKVGGDIKKVWKEGEDTFAQQPIEGVKTEAEVAKTEPTPPPAKTAEIPEKEIHKVRPGTKEETVSELRVFAKRAPESLSDIPKDQPTWIQVDHEGTIFTIANTADALNFYADNISKMKKGRIGPVALKTKPPAPPRVSGKRPKVDVDAGETYIRVYTEDTKFRKPRDSEVWELRARSIEAAARGEETYLYRTKYKGRTWYSDGRLIEFRDTAPKTKVGEFVEPPGDPVAFIERIEKGKFSPAKPTFDTEVGVAIMNEKSGFFISHDYFDYVRSKYGPQVKWEIPEPGTFNPLKFSVNGKLQGYVAPFDPGAPHGKGLVATPHSILAERLPEGFKPGPTIEAGGLQTMYEGVRDVI